MKTKEDTKLIVEHLRTGKKWVPKERIDAAMFVGETLENVVRYKDGMIYLVGGEEYVIYSTSDLTNPKDFEV